MVFDLFENGGARTTYTHQILLGQLLFTMIAKIAGNLLENLLESPLMCKFKGVISSKI